MDKKGQSTVSTSDSYYFQLIPSYFKVEHGFAKTIKPNTTYRLSIFKGIQKADEMAEGIKSKIVGGKILFDQTSLSFYLPLYSPTRNIEFTLKVLETKPNAEETEIASYKIKSGDFVKKFKSEEAYLHKQEVELIQNLSLNFELFVHNSKAQLQKIIKDYQHKGKAQSRNNIATNRGKTPKKNQFSSEIYSQSEDVSDTASANRQGIFAAKKKLSRKRGHHGKLRSKNGSPSGSEVSSSRSRSSRKSFGPFPHNEQNERFVHSPKKVSPPKVEEHEGSSMTPNKSGKKQNLVSVGRKDSQISEVRNRAASNLTPTKFNKIQSTVERQMPTDRHRKSQLNYATQKKSPLTKEGKAKQIHKLEIKTDQTMFDIERRNEKGGRTSEKKEQGKKQKQEANLEEKSLPPKKDKVTQPIQRSSQIKKTENAGDAEVVNIEEPISKPSGQVPKSVDKVSIKEEDKVQNSQDKSIKQASQSAKKAPIIQVREQAVVDPKEHSSSEIKMKASINLSNIHKLEEQSEEAAKKEYTGMRDKIFYTLFTIVSILLFWNAITPSSKV